MTGTLDEPTGLRLTRQTHVAEKGDYYRLDPDLPPAEAGDARPDSPADRTRQEEES